MTYRLADASVAACAAEPTLPLSPLEPCSCCIPASPDPTEPKPPEAYRPESAALRAGFVPDRPPLVKLINAAAALAESRPPMALVESVAPAG